MPTKYMDSVVPLESEADVVRLVQRMAADQTRMAKDLVRIGNDSLLHGRYITELCNKVQPSWAGAATAASSNNNNNNLAFLFPFLAGIKPPNAPAPTPAPAPTLTSPHVDPNRAPQISASGITAEFLPGTSATDHQMQVRTPTSASLSPTDENPRIAAQTITIAFATPYDRPPNVHVQVMGSQSVLLDLVTESQLVLSVVGTAPRAATTIIIMITVHPVARDRWFPGP